MKFLTLTSAALIALGGASSAFAQSTLSREQVRAELFDAVRTGNIARSGEFGGNLNELYASQYPAVAKPAGKTRAEVNAELAEARRTGDVIASWDANLRLNEIQPNLYPRDAQASQLTREQVKAELAEAVRTGSLVRAGDAG